MQYAAPSRFKTCIYTSSTNLSSIGPPLLEFIQIDLACKPVTQHIQTLQLCKYIVQSIYLYYPNIWIQVQISGVSNSKYLSTYIPVPCLLSASATQRNATISFLTKTPRGLLPRHDVTQDEDMEFLWIILWSNKLHTALSLSPLQTTLSLRRGNPPLRKTSVDLNLIVLSCALRKRLMNIKLRKSELRNVTPREPKSRVWVSVEASYFFFRTEKKLEIGKLRFSC